jgi:hypothetical protein
MGLSNSRMAGWRGETTHCECIYDRIPTSKGAHLKKAAPSKYALRLLATKIAPVNDMEAT